MGLSLSVVLANAYMEYFEETAIRTATDKPTLWQRYVDDVFCIWPHGEEKINMFHEHLNGIHTSIQFTREVECNGKLPFLDVLVQRKEGFLHTDVYRKPTHSNVYMKASSHHAPSTKAGVVRCLSRRARNLCSDRVTLNKELGLIRDVFQANGYSDHFLKKNMRDNQSHPREAVDDTKIKYVSIPYVTGLCERLGRLLSPLTSVPTHQNPP